MRRACLASGADNRLISSQTTRRPTRQNRALLPLSKRTKTLSDENGSLEKWKTGSHDQVITVWRWLGLAALGECTQTPTKDASHRDRKTQIAVEFAVRLRKRSPKTWVFWVHAGSVASFTQSYREITEAAKMPGRDDPKIDTLDLVLRWMKDERNGPWLMIVDNNDDSELLFAPLGSAGTDQTYGGHSTAPAHATVFHVAFTFPCRDADWYAL